VLSEAEALFFLYQGEILRHSYGDKFQRRKREKEQVQMRKLF